MGNFGASGSNYGYKIAPKIEGTIEYTTDNIMSQPPVWTSILIPGKN